MAVYTDGKHLVADTIDELHRFAEKMNLKRLWFQDHRHPHYDLTTKRAVMRAISGGATMVTPREAASVMTI